MSASLYSILNDIRAIDDKIKELNKKKSGKPALLIGSRKKLSDLENKSKTKGLELESETKKQKHLEDIIVGEKDKLQKAEEKMNLVKNSKEYQAAQKEVSQFKKTVSNLDEQRAAKQTVIDALQKEFEIVDAELKNLTREYEAVMVNVKDDLINLDTEIMDLTESRNKIVETLPQDIKTIYRKAYTNKGGVGVAVVNETRCGACNMSLPMQLCNDILKGDKVYHCPSCQRLIIYINNKG